MYEKKKKISRLTLSICQWSMTMTIFMIITWKGRVSSTHMQFLINKKFLTLSGLKFNHSPRIFILFTLICNCELNHSGGQRTKQKRYVNELSDYKITPKSTRSRSLSNICSSFKRHIKQRTDNIKIFFSSLFCL